MTDPLRRDPTEFLRVLRRMANTSSWQKAMIFAAKGRMVGYRMTQEHYNTILFSQSMWGRALEIVRVIRAMREDGVQPNGATYYYIVNGMANADHGYNYDFKLNHRLERLQHWRVALEALQACEANGFDSTDTMHNSVIITMCIPGFNHWQLASGVFAKMLRENRQLHPTMVKFYHDCLVRNMRPREASALLRCAAERGVKGYEDKWEVDVYAGRPHDSELDAMRAAAAAAADDAATTAAAAATTSASAAAASVPDDKDAASRRAAVALMALHLRGDQQLLPEQLQRALEDESARQMAAQASLPMPFTGGLSYGLRHSEFRPRVYRQLWYRWHAIANRYRPTTALKRRQLAPRDSPTGVPAWGRI